MNTSDIIDKLPVEDSLPDYKELAIVKEIFEKNKEGVKQIVSSVKDSLFVFVLFCIFSLPFIDTFIKKYTENQNASFIIKASLFTLIYFFVTNYYLIKK
jgi:hypothetical protein